VIYSGIFLYFFCDNGIWRPLCNVRFEIYHAAQYVWLKSLKYFSIRRFSYTLNRHFRIRIWSSWVSRFPKRMRTAEITVTAAGQRSMSLITARRLTPRSWFLLWTTFAQQLEIFPFMKIRVHIILPVVSAIYRSGTNPRMRHIMESVQSFAWQRGNIHEDRLYYKKPLLSCSSRSQCAHLPNLMSDAVTTVFLI
jgi:hypothetical protein